MGFRNLDSSSLNIGRAEQTRALYESILFKAYMSLDWPRLEQKKKTRRRGYTSMLAKGLEAEVPPALAKSEEKEEEATTWVIRSIASICRHLCDF
jgi:hypothetical protein